MRVLSVVRHLTSRYLYHLLALRKPPLAFQKGWGGDVQHGDAVLDWGLVLPSVLIVML